MLDYWDFDEAEKFLLSHQQELAKANIPGNQPDLTVAKALWAAFAISYSRPFKRSRDENESTEPRSYSSELSAFVPENLRPVHRRILSDRNKVFAHSDASVRDLKDVELLPDSGLGTVTAAREPYRSWDPPELLRQMLEQVIRPVKEFTATESSNRNGEPGASEAKRRRLPVLVRDLYSIVRELEVEYKRKFTLDGHLVGSIGEVVAAHLYDLDLLPGSTPVHDARSADGRLVQIKASQARKVGLRSQPDYLIVLKLRKDGSAEEVFNGPGAPAWNAAGPLQKNGQRSISFMRLVKLMDDIPKEERFARVA